MAKEVVDVVAGVEQVDHDWLNQLVEKQGVWATKGKGENVVRTLVGMKNNRPAKKARLALLLDNIKDEGWHNTGQGLIFDSKGNLIDGQHRVIALYNYSVQYPNKKFSVVIVRGVKPSAFDYIDCGVPRSAADTLYRSGVSTENHKELANAVRFLNLILQGSSLRAGGKVSNAHLHSMLKGQHKGLRDAMADVLAEEVELEDGSDDMIALLKKFAGLAYWGLFVYLASEKYTGTHSHEFVMQFLKLVSLGYDEDGEYIPRHNPISRLRDKLNGKDKPRGAEEKFRFIVNAFNLHSSGVDDVRSLNYGNTTPTLGGLDIRGQADDASPSQEEDAEAVTEAPAKVRRTRVKKAKAEVPAASDE